MAVPDFQSIMLPLLRLASQGSLRTPEAIAKISDEFTMSEEERHETLASGKQTRIANRVSWAFVHLAKAGLLQRETRGTYSITPAGQQVLAEKPTRIDINFLLMRSEAFRQFRNVASESASSTPGGAPHVSEVVEQNTPEERIDAACKELNGNLQSDLFERVVGMDDANFERLIVKLMLGLGYGAGGLGKRTGGPGDGAIDGIITEDILGLDVIYLQAKRNAAENTVGPDKIREFAGAMDAHGITKGVFVTTSRFTKAALEYAERTHKRLHLIDGEKLTRLMIHHGIGVRGYLTLELKKLDINFFDELGE